MDFCRLQNYTVQLALFSGVFMKKLLFTLMILASFSAFAGGSIFHHKSRSRNANGVDSIGAYVCGSLQCHDVVIKEGSCGGMEHATMQYGVCTCDEGYRDQNGKCVEIIQSVTTEEEFTDLMQTLNLELENVKSFKNTTGYDKSSSYKELVDTLIEAKEIADEVKKLNEDPTEENKERLNELWKKWTRENYSQHLLDILGLSNIIKISNNVKVSYNNLSQPFFLDKILGIKTAYAGIVGGAVSVCAGQVCTEASVYTLTTTFASYVPHLEFLECIQISNIVDKVINEAAIKMDWDIVVDINDAPNQYYQQLRAALLDWTQSELLEKFLPSGRRCCLSNEIKNEQGTCQRCPDGLVSLNDKECCSSIAENDLEGKLCCGRDEEISKYDSGNWYLGWFNSQSRCCPKGEYATAYDKSQTAVCCPKDKKLVYNSKNTPSLECCDKNKVAEADNEKTCCPDSKRPLTSPNKDTHCCPPETTFVKNNGTCCAPQDLDCICEVDPDQTICKTCHDPKPTGFCEYVCNSSSSSPVAEWRKVDPECCDNNDDCTNGYYCDTSDHMCQPCPTPKENCNIKEDTIDEHGCVKEKTLTCSSKKVCTKSGECECPDEGTPSLTDPNLCCKNKLLWAENTRAYTINSPVCSECPEDSGTGKSGVMSQNGLYCCKPETSDGWAYSSKYKTYIIPTPICGNCPTLNGVVGHPSKTGQLCCGSNNRIGGYNAVYETVSIKDCGCPDGGKYAPDGETCCNNDKVWDASSQTYKKENLNKCRCESGKKYYSGFCCFPEDESCICNAEPDNEICCSGDNCCNSISKPGTSCKYECQKDGNTYAYKWVKKDSTCCENDAECSGTSQCVNSKCCLANKVAGSGSNRVCCANNKYPQTDGTCSDCPEKGVLKEGICCKNGYSWNGTTYNGNSTVCKTCSSFENSTEFCCVSHNYEWCGNECAIDGKVCCSNGNAVSLSTKKDDQGGSINYVYSGECCSGNPIGEKNYCSYCVRDNSGNWSWQRFNSYKNNPDSWNEECLCDSERPTCNFYSGFDDGFPSSTYSSSDPYKCNSSGNWVMKNDYKTCPGGYCTYSDTCCPDPNPIRFHNEASGDNCRKCENGTWKLDDSHYKMSGNMCIRKYECGQNSDCDDGEVCYKKEFRCVEICSEENNYNGYSPSECICRRDGGKWCGNECAYEGYVCCNDGNASSTCCYNDYNTLPSNCYECVNHQLVPKGGNFKYCPVGKQCTDECCNFNLWQNGSCNVDATATCLGTAPSCGDSHYFSCLGNHQIRHTVRHSHMEGSSCKASDPYETDEGTVTDGSVTIPSISNYLKS